MSEYQYYEFLALDRPLSESEQQAVSELSSRVDPHPRRAVFVYHYSDLPIDERDLVAQYFDAMFYIANWGTTRLIFRLPKELVDLHHIELYSLEYFIEFETRGDYVLLDIQTNDEDGYGWIDGEGQLDSLVGLREDILAGDYRLLHLAWLAAVDSGYFEEEMTEPPVPAGLQILTPALERFIEVFRIGKGTVAAAARASVAQPQLEEHTLRVKIAALTRSECNEWLLRLAKGEEPHLSEALRRHLGL